VTPVSTKRISSQWCDVTTTTHRGTNALHGSSFWYHQNGASTSRFLSVRARPPFKNKRERLRRRGGGPVDPQQDLLFGGIMKGCATAALSQIQGWVQPPDSYPAPGDLSS